MAMLAVAELIKLRRELGSDKEWCKLIDGGCQKIFPMQVRILPASTIFS